MTALQKTMFKDKRVRTMMAVGKEKNQNQKKQEPRFNKS
jgi:hypothetical protein